ncbi:VENN motif pre-toxin domain-containing protein, partial [Providencia stuartii]|uniref:VENN motif pre-toxin domain-containing protein n=1 Tax=Providencia stuartii TaxID=588 RepID=UPI0011AF8232
GENAGAQSLGAMTAEAVGMLSKELYGKDASQLTEEEKATVSAFASLAAGIAGGLVGGDTSSAANAGQAGKTTVENNYLSFDEAREFDKAITKCRAEGSDCQPVIDHYSKLNKTNSDKYKADCDRYSLNCTAGYERLKLDGGISAAERPTWLYGSLDNEDVRNAVLYENQKDLEYGMSKSDNWDRLGAFVAESENVFGLLAGGKSLLSSNISTGAKLTGSGLSMGANGGVQLYNGNTGDKFDYLSFFSSGVTGWGGTGKSLQTNMGLNVGNAYLTSQVSGQDSEAAMVGAGFGTMLGYGLGSGITGKMEAAEIKNHFGMSASKKAFEYSDKSKYSNFITEGTKFSPAPGIIGGTAGSGVLEYSGSRVNNNIVSDKNNKRINDTKPQDKNKDNQ